RGRRGGRIMTALSIPNEVVAHGRPVRAMPVGPDAAHAMSALYGNVVAFIAVVAEGSFVRASDRLGVGRSAVSRSVQKLEEHLDTRLFARTTRSTRLTP